MTSTPLSTTILCDLYARMLFTRVVDNAISQLSQKGYLDRQGKGIASCRGHEAAQVGSAVCIKVGQDFTLPYYRDLGVMLTIGMTPYEIFCTYLQAAREPERSSDIHHWSYQKHNIVTGPAPVATQLLHAAGIAFASKLRKAAVATIAYCGDGIVQEPDFLEALSFAAQQQLPVIFLCEHDCHDPLQSDIPDLLPLFPAGLAHHIVNGVDVQQVYQATQAAIQHARAGKGPTLLQLTLKRVEPDCGSNGLSLLAPQSDLAAYDPLIHCQRLLQEQGCWDDQWAQNIRTRASSEVERALQDALLQEGFTT
ncbi:thiamine pyrophosphate-dependent dehydrogenase E1 component subunit alpha [Tengunoibacter tsumagoiensis]|uniref:2-oxoisovalerate dehydrogenase subunit alpha n=1 Tax=Tengunoibacter tsumagoiensis TaxID=2014871 RepID=A0A402A0F2_9CHLR|nr:thiamine pyrophosphate-dependent dehydrogenase E1 component subunit alpha [Tengunoibacter tsumagoiensis]GCE12565.1 2-oxoisovalerate dehydrogenase subunit alpha [Tengunoibacter tsumagoiensis]